MHRPMTILAFLATLAASAANMLPEGDFETWNAEKDQPAGAPWRWGFLQRGTNGFTVCALSTEVKHSGNASLHIKDAKGGSLNHSMWYQFTKGELKGLEGKVLRASAWIKQVSASEPRNVGIALSVTGDGASPSASNGTGGRGATDWVNVQVKVRVPKNPSSARLWINCAGGWGNTGEIYIDDLVVSADPADHPRPTLRKPEDDPAHRLALPEPQDDPEEAAWRAQWRDATPQEEDGRVRPEIRNGTWYVNGKPEYYLGVWIYNRTHIDWSPQANPLHVDHIAYTTPPGKEVFDFMGFNSAQISAAHAQLGAAVRGFPIGPKPRHGRRSWRHDRDDIPLYFKRFGDIPMVMDFAFGYSGSYSEEMRTELAQRKSGHVWHAFVPFCPHVPEGARYYRDYFLGGTRGALRNGCNVFLYELFNESAWNDMCRYEVVAFAQAMKAKYGTIAAANEAWGTVFDHFADVACQVDLKQFRGVWYDWCQYTSRSYCNLLEEGKKTIRSADLRKNVYFTEQAAGTPPVHRGMDYRMIAETLDALAIEGGWQYGFKTVYNAKNEMEAVVATSGSKHFFNCDFYRALVKDRKPVVNNEHYCTRLEKGKRVPSHRTDYITSLWLEVMHGVSANFTYVWDKRNWEAHTPEKAYANVVNPSYKSSSLLNPYNVKPEDLCAFRMFQEELAPYKEKLLPCPRTKPATVAVFFSKPTEIQRDNLPKYKSSGPAWAQAKDTAVSDWYVKLLHAHFPCKVVFEEDLADLGPEVRALVFPGSQCNHPETLSAARAFRAKGGLVFADAAAFSYDAYMKPLPAVPQEFTRVTKPEEIVEKLLAARVPRYAVLEPTDDPSKPLTASDAQVIDRGDFKFVCCVTMNDTATRRVTLRLNHLTPVAGGVRVYDPVAKRYLSKDGRDVWTAADLAAGLPLELPPQERVLLVLTAARGS